MREPTAGARISARSYPEPSDLAISRYTMVRLAGAGITVDTAPVVFTRVRPGDSLIREAAE